MTNPYDLREARRALGAAPAIDGKLKLLSDEVKSLAGRVKAIERFIERLANDKKTK